MHYEWDLNKAASNWFKHGVTFSEGKSIFTDPHQQILDDLKHSAHEIRKLAIGVSDLDRLLIVIFTNRSETTRRIISSRLANAKERSYYYAKKTSH